MCTQLLLFVFLFLLTRATASMFLEKQMQNVEGIVSGFEEQLAKDGAILDQHNVLPNRNQQLQVSYFIMQAEKKSVRIFELFQDRLI